MDIFEQIDLKSITEPIPPEPSPPWLIYAALLFVLLIISVGAVYLRKYRSQFLKYLPNRKKTELVQNIRQAFREYEKLENSPDEIDFDRWWLLVLAALKRRSIIERTDITIEEFQSILDHGEAMNMGDRLLFQDLTKLIDQHKFGGGLDETGKQQAVACFREIVKRLGGM